MATVLKVFSGASAGSITVANDVQDLVFEINAASIEGRLLVPVHLLFIEDVKQEVDPYFLNINRITAIGDDGEGDTDLAGVMVGAEDPEIIEVDV
jgi:hypothetical protein